MIKLKNARLSFPKLYEAAAPVPGADLKYGGVFIFAPDSPEYAKFKAEMTKLANEKWGGKAKTFAANIRSDKRMRCYGEGEEKTNQTSGEMYDGYEGQVFVSASNADQPKLFGRNGKPIDLEDALSNPDKFYGGCYVNVILDPWIQDNSYGKAMRCTLMAVQFIKDGEPLAGGKPTVSDDAFGAVDGYEDEDEEDFEF